ncbi:MAG: VTT domain-containing protein [Acidobacteriota bacterium]
MRGLIDKIQALALAMGAPGLFVVALLDSSFLSLPEIADLLVVWMVVQHKERLALYAASATLGSILGCLALYYVGLKGGEAMVRKRFQSATVDRALGVFRRFGIMAVLIPSVLPPPAPFKIFVLLSGVAKIPVPRFITAIAIGRGLRYFVEGLLALWYGERALVFIKENGTPVALAVVALLVVGLAAYLLWSRAQSADRR